MGEQSHLDITNNVMLLPTLFLSARAAIHVDIYNTTEKLSGAEGIVILLQIFNLTFVICISITI